MWCLVVLDFGLMGGGECSAGVRGLSERSLMEPLCCLLKLITFIRGKVGQLLDKPVGKFRLRLYASVSAEVFFSDVEESLSFRLRLHSQNQA